MSWTIGLIYSRAFSQALFVLSQLLKEFRLLDMSDLGNKSSHRLPMHKLMSQTLEIRLKANGPWAMDQG